MKRITIDNLDGGVVNKVNPQTQPDNTLTEAENYEYRDYSGIKMRKGVDIDNDLKNINLDNIKSFAVWYPNRLPNDMLAGEDRVYILNVGEREQERASNHINVYTTSAEIDISEFFINRDVNVVDLVIDTPLIGDTIVNYITGTSTTYESPGVWTPDISTPLTVLVVGYPYAYYNYDDNKHRWVRINW